MTPNGNVDNVPCENGVVQVFADQIRIIGGREAYSGSGLRDVRLLPMGRPQALAVVLALCERFYLWQQLDYIRTPPVQPEERRKSKRYDQLRAELADLTEKLRSALNEAEEAEQEAHADDQSLPEG